MTQNTDSQGSLATPEIPMYYMKMRRPQVHSRLGKMQAGQIVMMDQSMAARFLRAGAAEQVSSSEYEAQSQRKSAQVSRRQDAFYRLNQQAEVFDVSLYRDVLTAPESGLRRAYDAGVTLENLQYLRGSDGAPLDQDSDIEDILEARANMQPMMMVTNQRFQVQGGPQPLTPKYREYVGRVAQPFAGPPPDSATSSERQQRAARRKKTLHGDPNEPQLVTTEPPKTPAPPLTADQIANT